MTAVFVVAAIAVLGVVVARVTWRRPADERHSIQSHQQTLETLRSMADRRPGPKREVAGSGPGPTGSPARAPRPRPGTVSGKPVPSAPPRSGRAATAPVRPAPARVPLSPKSNGHGSGELVFVDDGAGPPPDVAERAPRTSLLGPAGGLHRSGRRDPIRRAGSRGGRWSRLAPVVTAAVVLVIAVAVALAFVPSHHAPKARPPAQPGTTAGHKSQTTVTTATPPQVRSTTSTATSAVYGAPSASYTLALTARGACWVDATRASNGSVVWTGTLQPGQTQSIPASGGIVVRLGAADAVDVTLNGKPVVLPAGYRSPFDMHFQSA